MSITKYLKMVLNSMEEAQRNGGIFLQVGNGVQAKTLKFYPVLMNLVADNQGAHCCMGCKTGSTKYPCRWCVNDSTECLFDMPSPLRNDDMALLNQQIAWIAFGKQVQGLPISNEEKQALLYCRENSIQPLVCTLLTLRKPYPSHNAYMYAPPDALHTLIAGLMKSWVLWTMTVIERVGKIIICKGSYM